MSDLIVYGQKDWLLGRIASECNGCKQLYVSKHEQCCGREYKKTPKKLSEFGSVINWAQDEKLTLIGDSQILNVCMDDGIDNYGPYFGTSPLQRNMKVEQRYYLRYFDKVPDYNGHGFSNIRAENLQPRIYHQPKINDKVGISSFGSWLPNKKISTKHFGGSDIDWKSIFSETEDVVTSSAESMRYALMGLGKKVDGYGTILLGSEWTPTLSQQYVNVIKETANLPETFIGGDVHGACSAGLASLSFAYATVKADMSKWAAVSSGDNASFLGRSDDDLKRFTGDGTSSFILEKGDENNLVAIFDRAPLGYGTYTPDYDVDDRTKEAFHKGRFTGSPAYMKHIRNVTEIFMNDNGESASNFKYAVIHSPNFKFPMTIGEELGFSKEQLNPMVKVSKNIGNTYSGITELCWALEHANPEDRIVVVKYGSGAQAVITSVRVTDAILDVVKSRPTVDQLLESRQEIDFHAYNKIMRKKENIHGVTNTLFKE